MRGLLPAAVLLYGVVVPGAFAVGRRNVDPETNMNIVSCGAGRGNAAGAGRVVAQGRAAAASERRRCQLGGALRRVVPGRWLRLLPAPSPAPLFRVLLRPLMPAIDLFCDF